MRSYRKYFGQQASRARELIRERIVVVTNEPNILGFSHLLMQSQRPISLSLPAGKRRLIRGAAPLVTQALLDTGYRQHSYSDLKKLKEDNPRP
jgi:hypothetical protein